MRRPTRAAWLLAFTTLAMSMPRLAQDAKSQSAKSEKAKPPEQKLNLGGVFGGKVLDMGEDGKSFLLRVYGQLPEVKFTPGNPASC